MAGLQWPPEHVPSASLHDISLRVWAVSVQVPGLPGYVMEAHDRGLERSDPADEVPLIHPAPNAICVLSKLFAAAHDTCLQG